MIDNLNLTLDEWACLCCLVEREITEYKQDLIDFSDDSSLVDYAEERLKKLYSIKSKLDNLKVRA